jgi:hypothetical protein
MAVNSLDALPELNLLFLEPQTITIAPRHYSYGRSLSISGNIGTAPDILRLWSSSLSPNDGRVDEVGASGEGKGKQSRGTLGPWVIG